MVFWKKYMSPLELSMVRCKRLPDSLDKRKCFGFILKGPLVGKGVLLIWIDEKILAEVFYLRAFACICGFKILSKKQEFAR